MSSPFRIEPLGESHDRGSFSCGREPLNRYFRTQASQDVRRRIAHCFVAVESSSGRIAGYYTVASAAIPILELPQELTKKLPRYPGIPTVLIGRLAVDLGFQRRGLGAALLADAAKRVAVAAPAAYALLVEAKDDSAAAFYRRPGFQPLLDRKMTLFLPVVTALKAFE